MPTQRELMNQASQEYGVGGGGGFFRFEKNGTYRLRILTPAWPLATHFFGKGTKPKVCYGVDKGCPLHGEKAPKDDEGNEKKPSVKFSCYIIDRADGQVKLAELPYSIISVVTNLQEDEDYKFDEFPMPYDIKVTFNKEEAASKMYQTLAAPNRSELSEEENTAFDEAMKKRTPEQYVESRKAKQLEADRADAVYEGNAVEANHEPAYEYPESEGEPTI